MDRVFIGLAGLLLEISFWLALGKSLGAALPALGKPRLSLLFYLDYPNMWSANLSLNIFFSGPRKIKDTHRSIYTTEIKFPVHLDINGSLWSGIKHSQFNDGEKLGIMEFMEAWLNPCKTVLLSYIGHKDLHWCFVCSSKNSGDLLVFCNVVDCKAWFC